MLPTPNNVSNIPSSGNDNDSSDDFSIVNTPSPQPQNVSPDNKGIVSIAKIKESEEIDEFEHLSMANISNINRSKSPNDNDSITSGERSEFDLIDIVSDNDGSSFQPDQEIKKLIVSPPDTATISTINTTDNQPETDEDDERKIEISEMSMLSPSLSNKSESSSPKATMDEIISLTEPHNSSSSNMSNDSDYNNNDNIIASDGPIITNPEHQPLIERVLSAQEMEGMHGNKRKNSYLKKEYERYVSDKKSDEKAGCNGFLCCRPKNMQNEVENTRDFFGTISCVMDFLGGYMDRCFGDDQFDDDYVQRKPMAFKQI